MNNELIYWIWLSLALSLPSRAVAPLLDAFAGSAGKVYEADGEDYRRLTFLTPGEKKKLADKDLGKAGVIFDYCDGNGVRILTFSDPNYPKRLKQIPDPPVLLYYRGTLPDFDALPCFAVVGTRAMSHYGAQNAFDISFDLARMGCVTVSGMALGIDGVAAASTLAAKGMTVAVCGCGIDYIYPSSHATLYREIIAGGGAVITEFSPFERPAGFHFPIRNRLISGLSRAVIVVEGDGKSGAMITAETAKKQGRDVFAVPGKIGDKNNEGPLLLLKNGAFPITCADDIYDRYREEYLSKLQVFHLLKDRPVTVYDVINRYQVTSTTGIGFGYASGAPYPREEHLSSRVAAPGRGNLFSEAVASLKQTPLLRRIFRQEESKSRAERPTRPEEETQTGQKTQSDFPEGLTETEKKIYAAIPKDKSISPDEISIDGITPAEIMANLTVMEIKGAVRALSGSRYQRTGRE